MIAIRTSLCITMKLNHTFSFQNKYKIQFEKFKREALNSLINGNMKTYSYISSLNATCFSFLIFSFLFDLFEFIIVRIQMKKAIVRFEFRNVMCAIECSSEKVNTSNAIDDCVKD